MNQPGIPESLLANRPSGERQRPAPAAAGQDPPGAPRAEAAPAARPKSRRLGITRRIVAYFEHHLQALFNTLGRMVRSPLSSLMTVAVIGIALALPTGLHVVLQNVQVVSQGWESAAQISLFLRKDIDDSTVQRIADEFAAQPEIAGVTHVSPSEALAEFQRLSGFGNALDALRENPLPPLIIVQPAASHSSPVQVENLLHALRNRSEVEIAQLDVEWVERLYAIMEIGKRAVLVLGVLLALAVLLVIGNTIRLAIQNRREEIVVQKLIGATNGFIRRPFLYNGFLYGFCGALFAWLLVTGSLWLLNGPVQRLSLLYHSQFEIGGLGLVSSGWLLLGGIVLGLAGAWLAVGRHLRDIEPR